MDFRPSKEILSALGQRARAARLHHELNQNELARRAGVSRDTIQRFERSGSCTLTNLVSICRVLDRLSEINQLFSEPAYSPREAFNAEKVKERTRAYAPRSTRGKSRKKSAP